MNLYPFRTRICARARPKANSFLNLLLNVELGNRVSQITFGTEPIRTQTLRGENLSYGEDEGYPTVHDRSCELEKATD